MAHAVELARALGGERVDQALGLAAIAGRFAEHDLASILDHLATAGQPGDAGAADRGGHRPRRRDPSDASQGRQLPTGKTLASWRPEESSIPQATQQALVTLEWIGRTENLAVAGPSGTGKSHFVEALAHAAIEADLRVAWFTLESLTTTIGKAKVDGTVARTVARVCRCDLIVVDDIGMPPAGQDAAEAFYRVVDAAYERRSVAVTSTIHPSGFDQIMPKTLATATVDRLLHHAHLVLTKGDSHRLAEALAGKGWCHWPNLTQTR
jgi:DNA replication protein DnaC